MSLNLHVQKFKIRGRETTLDTQSAGKRSWIKHVAVEIRVKKISQFSKHQKIFGDALARS